MVKLGLCLAVAACSFHPRGAETVDGPASIDVAPPIDAIDAMMIGSGSGSADCLGRWHDGSVRFGSATELMQLVVGGYDDDPFVTPDELTIYFDGSGATSSDIFSATRTTTADAFGAPSVVPSLSSPQTESKCSITGDGLDAFVASTATGGQGNLDIWEATRPMNNGPFGTWSEANLANVDTSDNEFDPAISWDGKHLYYAPVLDGVQVVAVSTRGSDGTFSAPAEITELADPDQAGDADPTPSRDELVMVFSSERTGTGIPMERNMWYATRATTSDAFSVPVQVPDLNTDDNDGGPYLTDDGCTLYFSSDRNASQIHLYVATVM